MDTQAMQLPTEEPVDKSSFGLVSLEAKVPQSEDMFMLATPPTEPIPDVPEVTG